MIRTSLNVIACLTLLTLTLSTRTAHADTPTDAFQAADCMFEPIPFSGLIEGENLACGYITVPEQHDNPDSLPIRLGVAIIDSLSDTPAPDPVIMAQGGPGGSTIDIYGAKAPRLIEALRRERDVILFDQRGTLYTQPSLTCPELIELTKETIDQNLSLEEAHELEMEALSDCRTRLLNGGVNLAAYNSLENAADVAFVSQALGYDSYNFYGVSYGTLLGLHLMKHHPERLRSVILDAVVPPPINFITEAPRSQDRAFSEFFAACAADTACQATYPDLETRFFNLIDRFNGTPVTIPVMDPVEGGRYEAVLNGDALEGVLFQLMYSTDFIPLLPKTLYDLEAGQYSSLSLILSNIAFDRTFSIGMYNSVICAEDADFEVSDIQTQGIHPRLAEGAELEYGLFLDMCQLWNVPELGPSLDEPTVSDIPTLLLSGRFDPITPPAFAEAAAANLSTSYSYTFPTTAHSALGTACADEIVATFLSAPTSEPDSSCLENEPSGPPFVTSANVLFIGLFAQLLSLTPTAFIEIGLLILFLAALLSGWLIWPLALIIRLIIRKPASQSEEPPRRSPWLAYLPRWLTLLIGLIGFIFLISLFIAVGLTIFDNEALLFAGLPMTYWPLFLLPPLMVLLTALMLLVMMMNWLRGYGSIWGRLYQLLLTVAALGYIGILGHWGMLTVLLGRIY